MTKHDPFIMLPHAVYDSPAFAALKPIDIAVLLLLIRKHNGHNNGGIALGVREAAKRCHCSQMTACRSFARLQKAGLISATYKGHLVPEIGRPDIATRWQLNFVKNSARMGGTPKGEGRLPNDTSGCFPGDTSPGPSVRFAGDTSLGAFPVIQSKDHLTAGGKAEGVRVIAKSSELMVSRSRAGPLRGNPNGVAARK
jgi:hypothetical protein